MTLISPMGKRSPYFEPGYIWGSTPSRIFCMPMMRMRYSLCTMSRSSLMASSVSEMPFDQSFRISIQESTADWRVEGTSVKK